MYFEVPTNNTERYPCLPTRILPCPRCAELRPNPLPATPVWYVPQELQSRYLPKTHPGLGKTRGMQCHSDFLGAGFEAARLDLEPDQFSARNIVLTRYLPAKDPRAALSDQAMPGNLAVGGAPNADSLTVLPPETSPQQPGEPDTCYYGSSTCRGELLLPLTKSLMQAQQQGLARLHEYLSRELGGRDSHTATRWQLASSDPKFALVYAHGWNDCFYQSHLARMFSHLGGTFYTLNLYHYGRSMPQWQGKPWNGYTEDFTDYNPKLNWAAAYTREEHPDLPLLVVRHSMGGLVVSGRVACRRSDFDGLTLDSPQLVRDVSGAPAGEWLRRLSMDYERAKRFALSQSLDMVYPSSLVGYQAIGSSLPHRLVSFQNDPSATGWVVNPKQRTLAGAPMMAGWISAVLQAHRQLVTEATLPDKPVLCLGGNRHLDSCYQAEVTRVDAITR